MFPSHDHAGNLNSVLGFFVLRTDPLNAINNMIGHNVLFQSEIRNVIKMIEKANSEAGLLKSIKLDLPGDVMVKYLIIQS